MIHFYDRFKNIQKNNPRFNFDFYFKKIPQFCRMRKKMVVLNEK